MYVHTIYRDTVGNELDGRLRFLFTYVYIQTIIYINTRTYYV